MNNAIPTRLSGLPCPVCRETLDGAEVRVCAVCQAPVHVECGDYVGGCVRYACVEAATPRGRVVAALSALAQCRLTESVGQTLGSVILSVYVVTTVLMSFSLLPAVAILLPICYFALKLLSHGSARTYDAWSKLQQLSRGGLADEELVTMLGDPNLTLDRMSEYRWAALDNLKSFKFTTVLSLATGVIVFPKPACLMFFYFAALGFVKCLEFSRSADLGDRLLGMILNWRDEFKALQSSAAASEGDLLLKEVPSDSPPKQKNEKVSGGQT